MQTGAFTGEFELDLDPQGCWQDLFQATGPSSITFWVECRDSAGGVVAESAHVSVSVNPADCPSNGRLTGVQ